ncbi:TonB-dependent receptor domain-containing protein [Salinimicrobium soli]|uniref:TonB-dependent receptor domain-containing protein n=1 Tax=Salinimicrobium soli TaxID=1254399 RepID=UPI003AAC4A04
MKINSLRNSVFIIFFLATGFLYSQEIKSDSIVVVSSYTPSVHDAFKIKEKPSITDSVNLEKKTVQYSIFSVPVASTFTPAKGRATTVERERPPKLYDNYITLGFGSYKSVLAEFYSNLEINRTDNFGIFLTHNSAQGGIENVVLDDNYYDTELNLNYSSRGRDLIWNMDFGAEHQLYNWYGVPTPADGDTWPEFDPQHNYLSAYIGGEVNLDDSFFNRAKARYRYFRDDFESAEHHFTFKPTLELPIGGEIFNTNLVLDFVNGSFDREYLFDEGINYSFLNVGLQSGLVILRDDLTLNLGAAVYYSLDTEASDGGIYVYPQVTASYRMAGEYFIAYAGLEGDLKQNTYYNFASENPFLSPTLTIRPTDQQYNAYVGAKGKLSNSVGYNIRGGYMAEDVKPLFLSNHPILDANNQPYTYGNSFSVVYDQVKTISAFGELNFDVSSNFNLRVNGEYFIYDTDQQQEAWNLPDFKANLLADYQITKNWFAGANFFLVGERKDLEYGQNGTPIDFEPVTLDGYFDMNANLGYRFNDRLSIFAKGNNLLGENYEKWKDYPVLGLQLMAGATYKFDWGR